MILLALLASFAALPAADPSGREGPAAAPGSAAARAPEVPRPRGRPGSAAPALAEGRQPLAFVVHPTRPPLGIGAREAYGLVVGSITDWGLLRGRPEPVRLVLGPAGASRAVGLWLLRGRLPRTFLLAGSEAAAAEAVAREPRAVGLVAAAALSPAVRALSLAGTDPARDPAAYPLTVPGPGPPGPVITAVAVGDILTSRTVDRKMVALGDFTAPFRSVGRALAAADLAFGNFEGTISRTAAPRPGGTSFVSRVRAIEGLRFAGLDYLSLANNHTGDFGPGTLVETVGHLRRAGIATSGAGANDAQAREPAIVARRGVRFAFLSFNAIIGTPPAGPSKPGAVTIRMAPWFPFRQEDLDRMVADIRRARARADVVIVFPHWGQEYTAFPNPDQKRVGRALIDAGADMVIATHPHWVQGAELYRGRLIAYSLGNFVFDQTWSVETQQGAALELVFWGPRLVAASFVPVQIEDAHRPRLLDYRNGAEILERIWRASGEPYRRGA